jgi:hypothetical protein
VSGVPLVWDVVDRLGKSAAAVKDPALRLGLARELVSSLDPAGLADLMSGLAVAVQAGDQPRAEIMLFVAVALTDPRFDLPRSAAAFAAAGRGQPELARLLARDRTGEAEDLGRVPDFGVGRPLTLGERKSLARTKDRRLILRAIRDPDPSVIGILLGNPRLVEEDVVRLAATRPCHPEILLTVLRSVRWVVRYRVRRTLTMNPHTPLDVAMQLAFLLNKQDAQFAYNSGSLRLEVRQISKRIAQGPGTFH